MWFTHLPVQRPEVHKAAQSTLDMLIRKLARVGPVLEEIKRARSLVFIQECFSKGWQLLSCRADELHRELDEPLR